MFVCESSQRNSENTLHSPMPKKKLSQKFPFCPFPIFAQSPSQTQSPNLSSFLSLSQNLLSLSLSLRPPPFLSLSFTYARTVSLPQLSNAEAFAFSPSCSDDLASAAPGGPPAVHSRSKIPDRVPVIWGYI